MLACTCVCVMDLSAGPHHGKHCPSYRKEKSMSLDAYSAEKDGEEMDLRKDIQIIPGKVWVRDGAQKTLDKIRRLLTAIDMELEEKEPDADIVKDYAQKIADELTEFL